MRRLVTMCFVRRLWAPVMALVVMSAGCGDDGPVKALGETYDSLVFTRENGSVVEFSADAEIFVWCGPWETDYGPIPSLIVWFGDPEQPGSQWVLKAVVSDI